MALGSGSGGITSPRLAAVAACARELIETARVHGAHRVALCGSVARRDDKDGSDIDFYVFEFAEWNANDARARGNYLVRDYRKILKPYSVDIRGIPGWPVDPDFEAAMKRDSIDLQGLLDAAERSL